MLSVLHSSHLTFEAIILEQKEIVTTEIERLSCLKNTNQDDCRPAP